MYGASLTAQGLTCGGGGGGCAFPVSAEGDVTPFQAMTTALAATVGTGNIAGVAGAIALGGPGAVFWMWVSALLGMATKYAEVVLAIRFREKNARGEWVVGGDVHRPLGPVPAGAGADEIDDWQRTSWHSSPTLTPMRRPQVPSARSADPCR